MSQRYLVQAKRPNLKRFLLATVAVLVAGASSSVALAQQASGEQASGEAAASTAVDEVVITGYRKSLSDARKIKKDSVVQIDAIVAEDMAKFPELNLAESLQRLPGVQINREAGEGRRISLRGLGPDFARVQLNGMEVLGNVDSAQDSRGQRSRDRAFDFNIFASELFSRVEVEKTFQAAQNEGGMAGTVGLFTGKPFDYGEGQKGALTAKVGTNEYTKDTQYRIAALYSYNWNDQFGVALSIAYGKRSTTEQGHNTYNYSHPSASALANMVSRGLDISHLSVAQQTKFLSGDLYFADGNRLSSWDAQMTRLGITGAMQWKPTDKLKLTLDVLHGEFTTHREELHLATRPFGSGTGSTTLDYPPGTPWPAVFQSPVVVNNIRWDSSNYATLTDVTGATFGSENRRSLNENRFNQAVLTGKWDPTDRLTIDGHVGTETSSYKTPYDDKLYMRAKGNLIADFGVDGRSASYQYPGWDPTNAANWAMDNFYYRGFNNESKLQEGVLNVRYQLNDVWSLRAGVAYHHFSQAGIDLFYDSNVNGTTGKTRGTSVADITNVFTNDFGSWLVGDYAKAFAKYREYHRFGPNTDGSGGALQDIENVYKTSEKTVSEYVQADWNTELFGKRFRGNIGLRGYQTDTRSTGWIQGDSYAYLGTADVKGSYDGVLPAMNSVLDLTPDLLLRFAVTKNLNRPSLGSMAARGSAFEDNGEISVSRGNPNLKPFVDTTYDVALEYYFGKVGLLSVGVFQKDIKNFIEGNTIHNIPFSQTGVPFSSIPGATASTIVDDFDMPTNNPDLVTLTGVELAAQAQFTFLPAPFDNLGAVVNYTYVDSTDKLSGISPQSFNVTLYYETAKWGLRGSLNHRDRWYTGYASSVMDAGTRGFEASTYVDAAAFYNVTDKFQVTLDAINLTNQKDTQFWGQNRYLYNQTQSGTTYMVGAGYKF